MGTNLAELETIIRDSLGDEACRFVFPSSVAAEHWQKEALCFGSVPALAGERFISWDSFKEAVLAGSLAGMRPAYRALRLLFCADILAKNAAKPFLKALIPPAQADAWPAFLSSLASSLPATSLLGSGSEPLLADYARIRTDYRVFLKARGFFEPNWEIQGFDSGGLCYLIFFPELIEDFPLYAETLASRPANEVRVIQGLAQGQPELRLYSSLLTEIRSALSRIGEAIDSGEAEPSQIALSLPGLGGLRPYLEREARILGIPADFRSGQALDQYPAGRFFSRLGRAADSSFAFEDLRDLLLCGGIPWREPHKVRRLIQFGLRYTVLCSWKSSGREIDPWLASFRRCGSGYEAEEALYRGLKTQVLALREAKAFAALKAAWQALSHSFLNPDAFCDEVDRVFARCVLELEALRQAQLDAGFATCPAAYGLFLESLSAVRYVPPSQSGGVRFYEYRVSAGIRPKLHFILNASQVGVGVQYGGAPFLREDLRSGLNLEQLDVSADFAKVYALSGSKVMISCSSEGLDGAQIPHGCFVVHKPEEGGAEEGDAAAGQAHPLKQEVDFYLERASFPSRLSSVRRASLEAAAQTFLTDKGLDMCAQLAPRMGNTGLENLKSLNASNLGAYRSCPFKWFFSSALRAQFEPSGIAAFDARFMGIARHSALEYLFGHIAADGAFHAARLAAYLEMADQALEEARRSMEGSRGVFAGLILEAGREALDLILKDILKRDATFFDGAEIAAVEKEFSLEAFAGGRELVGRLDRLMLKDGEAWIIDYKSKTLAANKYGRDKDHPEDFDFQIPAYALLLGTQAELRIGGALLYNVKDKKYRTIVAAACPSLCQGQRARILSLSELLDLEAALGPLAASYLVRIEAGDFMLAPRRDRERRRSCANCSERSICRIHYQVR